MRVEAMACAGSFLLFSRHLAARLSTGPSVEDLVSALKSRLQSDPNGYSWVAIVDEPLYQALMPHKHQPWARALFPIAPRHPAFPLLCSKFSFVKLMPRYGLPVPRSKLCTTLAQTRTAGKRLGYPLVARGDYGFAGSAVRMVQGPEEMAQAWRDLAGPMGMLLQRRVLAPTYAVQALYKRGRLISCFSSLKVLQWPEPNGPEACTCPCEPAGLQHYLRTFGKASGYHGLAALEFFYDGERFLFFEINCRAGALLNHPHFSSGGFISAFQDFAGWSNHQRIAGPPLPNTADNIYDFPDHLIRALEGHRRELWVWLPFSGHLKDFLWDEPWMLLRECLTVMKRALRLLKWRLFALPS